MRAVHVLGVKPQVVIARKPEREMIVLQVVAAYVYLMPRSGRVSRRHVRFAASAPHGAPALSAVLGAAGVPAAPCTAWP